MSHGHRNRIAALAMQGDPASVPEGVTPERADSDEPAAAPAAPKAKAKAKAKAKRKGARRGS